MANPNRRLRLLASLREFSEGMDITKYLKSEHRQNLKAIEDALREPEAEAVDLSSVERSTGASGLCTQSNAGGFADVTGMSVSISSHARPVLFHLVGGTATTNSSILSNAGGGRMKLSRTNPDASVTYFQPWQFGVLNREQITGAQFYDPGSDLVSGSTYIYGLQIETMAITDVRMVGHEI